MRTSGPRVNPRLFSTLFRHAPASNAHRLAERATEETITKWRYARKWF